MIETVLQNLVAPLHCFLNQFAMCEFYHATGAYLYLVGSVITIYETAITIYKIAIRI